MNPWGILGAVLLAIGLAGGGYYEGWSQRGDHEAALQLVAERAAAKRLAAETARADGLAAQLVVEQGTIHERIVEVIKEVPKVTTVYVEKSGEEAKTIPPAVIVWGAVRLFNSALRPDLPDSAIEFAYPTGATDITRAPVDTPDILSVHIENAGKYAACRAQLNKLIDFELGRGSAPPKPVQ